MALYDTVTRYTPWAIRHLSRRMKREINWLMNARRPLSQVFDDVYAAQQ